MLTQILSLLPTLKDKCQAFETEWRLKREAATETDFEGYKSVSMAGTNDEVIDHYPPQYIIGPPVGNPMTTVDVQESDLVTVRLYKVEVEYMYGNPTGLYNLSMPEKAVRNHLNHRSRDKNYADWKRSLSTGMAAEFENDRRDRDLDAEEEEDTFAGLDVRHWHEHSLITELYRIDVENNGRDQVKVEVGVEAANPDEDLNCVLPLTSY